MGKFERGQLPKHTLARECPSKIYLFIYLFIYSTVTEYEYWELTLLLLKIAAT